MANIKLGGTTALSESGGTVVLDSAVTGIPAAGVTGVLPVAVTGGSGLTALGTVASGTIGGNSVVNTSGAITTTGAFTSKGIDDNATSTAMTIDSSGNVTTTNNPRFSAYHSTNGSVTVTYPDPFPFDATVINVGNHFDTSSSNYKFTAPVTGDYYLYFQVIFQGTSTNGWAHFVFSTGTHQGHSTHFNEEFSNASAWKQVILSGMYHMTAGCTVWVKMNTITAYHGGHYCMFCGHLIG